MHLGFFLDDLGDKFSGGNMHSCLKMCKKLINICIIYALKALIAYI